MSSQIEFDTTMRTVLERELTLAGASGERIRSVCISIFEPRPVGEDWMVWFEIRDLEKIGSVYRFRGIQVDSLGACVDALHHLALKLMTSDEYQQGCLYWLEPKDQCGLPLPSGYADL